MLAREQLGVDDELAEEDSRPEAEPPEVEGGDPEAGGRPDRAHRRRVAEALRELGGTVVGDRESEDGADVPGRLRAQESPGGPCDRAGWGQLHLGLQAVPPRLYAPSAQMLPRCRQDI